MAEDQTRQFIDQATQSLQNGQPGQALELAELAVALSPQSAEAHLLKAIALSQTNQPQAATDAFRQSVALDAGNAKAHFNFAVHLYSLGQKVEALAMAQEASRLDPTHAGARDLILRIESESGQAAAAPPPGGPATEPVYTAQAAGSGSPAHSIPFVGNMGPAWSGIGVVLAVAQLALIAYMFMAIFPLFGKYQGDPNGMSAAIKAATPPGLNFVGWIAGGGMLFWTILDLADRRGNWLWLIPQVVCGCCGCGFITLPIYLAFGRKQTPA